MLLTHINQFASEDDTISTSTETTEITMKWSARLLTLVATTLPSLATAHPGEWHHHDGHKWGGEWHGMLFGPIGVALLVLVLALLAVALIARR